MFIQFQTPANEFARNFSKFMWHKRWYWNIIKERFVRYLYFVKLKIERKIDLTFKWIVKNNIVLYFYEYWYMKYRYYILWVHIANKYSFSLNRNIYLIICLYLLILRNFVQKINAIFRCVKTYIIFKFNLNYWGYT